MTDRISLRGLRCVNAGMGMTAGLIGKLLHELGVDMQRCEPAGGDPSRAMYPAYPLWHSGARSIGRDQLDAALAEADLCVIGGEAFPGLDWRFAAEDLAARNPRLLVIAVEGFVSPENASVPALDILAQAATGFTNLHYADRANLVGTPLPSLGAALFGMIGAQAALLERTRSGMGQVVRVSLEEGAAFWLSCVWSEAERPSPKFMEGHTPRGVIQPIFETADGKHLLSLYGTPGAVLTTYRTLGIDAEADPDDRGMVSASRGLRNYFGDRDLLEPAFAKLTREEALTRLWQAGLTAEAVLSPSEVLAEEQVEKVGLVRTTEDGWRAFGSPIERIAGEQGSASTPAEDRGKTDAPLAGIRVLDLGSWVAGPYSGKLLGDLGAEVIKVETPQGDPVRQFYKNFSNSNRGKKFVRLDLKSEEGRDALFRLVETADLVVHNFRIGVDERLGIDPARIHARNPNAVCVSISAYGSQGPKATNPGFDPMIQAYCGHSHRSGGEGNSPMILPVSFIDYGTGAIAAMTCLHGLLLRSQGWRSLSLSTSLLHTGTFLLSELAVSPEGEVLGVPPVNHAQTAVRPGERLLKAVDGWIAVALRSFEMVDGLHRALGIAAPPAATWNDLRLAEIEAAAAALPVKALRATLEAGGVWCMPCVPDAWARFAHAPADARAPFVRSSQSTEFGMVTHVGPLVRFGRSRLSAGRPDIRPIGHDNDTVLTAMAGQD